MHPEIEQLVSLAERASEILQAHGHAHWAQWLRSDAQRLRNGDAQSLTHLLSAFGGMGSLNDVVLQSESGSALQNTLERLCSLATELAREEGA